MGKVCKFCVGGGGRDVSKSLVGMELVFEKKSRLVCIFIKSTVGLGFVMRGIFKGSVLTWKKVNVL